MVFEPGMMVTPQLRLVRLLGEGGMGSVWVADHLSLQTQVAIKFISKALAQDQAAVARFVREASSAAQIKSPHCVQMFDHGVTTEGIPYMVMELLEGEDVRHRLERMGGLSLEDTAKVLTQAAKALGKAHQLGIVHRDIKADNLFLVESDGDVFVKVLDFGIAKRMQTQDPGFGMTRTGSMVGTPYYMSPEQVVSAKHVDHRSDLWSLAVVAYHCVTGRVPFDGETIGALCIAIDRGVFTPATTLRQGLPPAVDAWFARALARDPSARFQSAKELADAFQSSLHAPWPLAPSMPSYPDAPAYGKSAGGSGALPTPTFSGAAVSGADIPRNRSAAPIVLAVVLGLGGLAFAGWMLRGRLSPASSEPPAGTAGATAVVEAPAPAQIPEPSLGASVEITVAPSGAPSASAPATAVAAKPVAARPGTPAARPTSAPKPTSKDRGF